MMMMTLIYSYFKFVTRAVEKADMMLKLLGTPVSYLAASFHNMYALFHSSFHFIIIL